MTVMLFLVKTLFFNCLAFVGLGEFGFVRLEDCHFVTIINPVREDLTKLYTNAYTLLLLISCQKSHHFYTSLHDFK
jgi:hypothetical protein